MKGKHRIEIKYKDIHYILDVKRKFTIVTGETGSGKTSLCEILNERLKYRNRFVKIRSIYPIRFCDNTDKVLSIGKDEEYLVFLDEGSYLKDSALLEHMSTSKSYYIIFSRYDLSRKLGSLCAICNLVTSDTGVFSLEEKYA